MDNNIVIGKYTLESLTSGMYASPKDLYREYIQNAVDAADLAIVEGIIKKDDIRIDIKIDTYLQKISIEDNGCGIKSKDAIEVLTDIGNSKKRHCNNRGFRGIGRLSGLGYCKLLTFSTSAFGEQIKTIISFNAERLGQLLIPSNNNGETITDVLNEVITISTEREKENKHFFSVQMDGVTNIGGLLDLLEIKTYLIQNLPLQFSDDFKWGGLIYNKVEMEGYQIPQYKIYFTGNRHTELLTKPYLNSIVADRIKKIEKPIQDIKVISFSLDGNKTSAILWYAEMDYCGTVLNDSLKGIRVRHGNILIGDKLTLNQFFKEERFNGWIIGEFYIIDDKLIPNSRRDNFENNDAYFMIFDQFRDWAQEITKEIRKLSYERSLSDEKKVIMMMEEKDDINDLCSEDIFFTCENELTLENLDESYTVANNDLADKLLSLLGKKNNNTKYTALNINKKLTFEQKIVLERVFNVISRNFDNHEVEKFINIIACEF